MADSLKWFVNRKRQWELFEEMIAGGTPTAAMLITGEQGIGKSFLLKKMIDHCQDNGVPHAHLDLAQISNANYLTLARAVRTPLRGPAFNQLTERVNFWTHPERIRSAYLVPVPDDTGGDGPETRWLDLNSLGDKIHKTFVGEELTLFANELDLDLEELERTEANRGRDVLRWIERRDRLEDAILHIVRQRPRLEWWDEALPDLGLDTLPTDLDSPPEAVADAQMQINTALFEGLALTAASQRIALFIDHHDDGIATAEAREWLTEICLDPIDENRLKDVLVFVAGLNPPEYVPPNTATHPVTGEDVPLVDTMTLQQFKKKEIEDYMAARPVALELTAEQILQVTDGWPDRISTFFCWQTPLTAGVTDRR